MKFDENKGVRGKKEEPVDCFDDDELEEEGERRKEAAACCLLKGEERERAPASAKFDPNCCGSRRKKAKAALYTYTFRACNRERPFAASALFFYFGSDAHFAAAAKATCT